MFTYTLSRSYGGNGFTPRTTKKTQYKCRESLTISDFGFVKVLGWTWYVENVEYHNTNDLIDAGLKALDNLNR